MDNHGSHGYCEGSEVFSSFPGSWVTVFQQQELCPRMKRRTPPSRPHWMVMFTRFWHFRQNTVTYRVNDILNYFAGFPLYVACKLCDCCFHTGYLLCLSPPAIYPCLTLPLWYSFSFSLSFSPVFFPDAQGANRQQVRPVPLYTHLLTCVFTNRMVRMV